MLFIQRFICYIDFCAIIRKDIEGGRIMPIQESGEMYLESILVLSRQKDAVRAIDIVEYMKFSKPSVSRALSRLREDGLINTDADGFITFTENGRALAEKIYTRHVVLTDFFVKLGVSDENASADACRIEHIISDETFAAMANHAGLMKYK